MRLPPEGARWLVTLRFEAAAGGLPGHHRRLGVGSSFPTAAVVLGRRRFAGVQPAFQAQSARLGDYATGSGTKHLPANSLRSGGAGDALVFRRSPAESVRFLFRLPHDHCGHVPSRPPALRRGRCCHAAGGWAAAVGMAGVDSPVCAAFPGRAGRPAANQRSVRTGGICGDWQHAVDGRVLHHGDSPLRRPGPRGNPPEGETPGDRSIGGRDRASDRQSAGRRAELPAEDRRRRSRGPSRRPNTCR